MSMVCSYDGRDNGCFENLTTDTLKYHHSTPPSLIRPVHYECSTESTTTAFGDFNARRGRQDVLYIYYNTQSLLEFKSYRW